MFVLESEEVLVLAITAPDVAHLQEALTLTHLGKKDITFRNIAVVYGRDKQDVLKLLREAGFTITAEAMAGGRG